MYTRFSSNGGLFAISDGSQVVTVWDTTSSKLLCRISKPDWATVKTLAWSTLAVNKVIVVIVTTSTYTASITHYMYVLYLKESVLTPLVHCTCGQTSLLNAFFSSIFQCINAMRFTTCFSDQSKKKKTNHYDIHRVCFTSTSHRR